MQVGDFLQPFGGDEATYRIVGLAATGRSFQIVRCEDVREDQRVVYAKAPRYRTAEEGGPDRDVWREAMAFEFDLLEKRDEGLVEPVELLDVEGLEDAPEPVLVYEPHEGDNLYDYIAKRPAGTVPIETILACLRSVGRTCQSLHEAGFVYRDLDPRHVIVSDEGEYVGMVGSGNIAEMGARPFEVTSDYRDAPYVAPEVRNERSGETLRPAADVYGLAALASYAFTKQQPETMVESPLDARAYESLRQGRSEGIAEFVAAGLQPVAKHRVALEDYLELATEAGLGRLGTEAAGEELERQPLPEPWAGAEPPETNRAEQSKLSPGPLISVPTGDMTPSDASDAVEGIKSAPVREFLGDRDDEPEGRTDADGAPVREVSMIEENLGSEEPPGADDEPDVWEQTAQESPLPPLGELPLKVRVMVGLVIPVAAIVVVVLLGFLGVY